MIYAPVLIPTLCRFDHFKRCIESLAANTWAKKTDIYIGLDYPLKESQYNGYKRIKDYLDEGIQGFNKVVVIEREENYGAGKNNFELRFYVSQLYDRYIMTEDDNAFSPYFLEYIDKMLEASKDADDIVAVCGYSYPISWKKKDENPAFLEQSFFSAWGYGIFSKKYELIKERIEDGYLEEIIYNKHLRSRLKEISPKNYCYLSSSLWHGDTSIDDKGISQYLILDEKYVLMPYVSLVRNFGWDGSGCNCNNPSEINYSGQEIQEYINLKEKYEYKDFKSYKENEVSVNSLYAATDIDMLKAQIKYNLMRLTSKYKRMS